jgi:hypothetical protein
MKYMLFIYPDSTVAWTPEDRGSFPDQMRAWVAEMDARGVRLDGHVLTSPDQARTVRTRDGVTELGTGLVNPTNPQLTGFDILECADIDEALEVVSTHPMARIGTLEIRAFAES